MLAMKCTTRSTSIGTNVALSIVIVFEIVVSEFGSLASFSYICSATTHDAMARGFF